MTAVKFRPSSSGAHSGTEDDVTVVVTFTGSPFRNLVIISPKSFGLVGWISPGRINLVVSFKEMKGVGRIKKKKIRGCYMHKKNHMTRAKRSCSLAGSLYHLPSMYMLLKPFVRLTFAAEAAPILYPLYIKSKVKSPTDMVRYDGLNISRNY